MPMNQRQIAVQIGREVKDYARATADNIPKALRHPIRDGQIQRSFFIRTECFFDQGFHIVSLAFLDHIMKFYCDFGSGKRPRNPDFMAIDVKDWGVMTEPPNVQKMMIANAVESYLNPKIKKGMCTIMNSESVFFEWFRVELERRVREAWCDHDSLKFGYDIQQQKDATWILHYGFWLEGSEFIFSINPDIDPQSITDTTPFSMPDQLFDEALEMVAGYMPNAGFTEEGLKTRKKWQGQDNDRA